MNPLIKNTRNTIKMKIIGILKTPISILTINGIFLFEDLSFDTLGLSRSTFFRSDLFLFVFLWYSRSGEVVLPYSSQEILYFLQ